MSENNHPDTLASSKEKVAAEENLRSFTRHRRISRAAKAFVALGFYGCDYLAVSSCS